MTRATLDLGCCSVVVCLSSMREAMDVIPEQQTKKQKLTRAVIQLVLVFNLQPRPDLSL